MACLLVTCLLHVGFSDCSSAKYKAPHAVKALHSLKLPHDDIRESSILSISEADHTCKDVLVDVGCSRLCIPGSPLCTNLFDRDVSAMGLCLPDRSILNSSNCWMWSQEHKVTLTCMPLVTLVGTQAQLELITMGALHNSGHPAFVVCTG